MGTVKSNVNVKIDTAVKEQASQLLDLINQKKIPHRTVEVNSDGHLIADKAKDPELYDWAVNG